MFQTSTDTSSGGGSNNKRKQTLTMKFKSDLDSLMLSLRATIPNFIRCIKPNDDQISSKFDSKLVLTQLKYSGLFEAINIRKSGYSVRIPHDLFIHRYKYCVYNDTIMKNLMVNNKKEYITKVLSNITTRIENKQRKTPWLVGNTKVFIINKAYLSSLDNIRKLLASNAAAIPVQALIRSHLTRKKYLALMAEKFELLVKIRKNQLMENRYMKIEDTLSKEAELIFRNDIELQKRLREQKLERIKMEFDRKQKLTKDSVVKIQKIIRGRHYNKKHIVIYIDTRADIPIEGEVVYV